MKNWWTTLHRFWTFIDTGMIIETLWRDDPVLRKIGGSKWIRALETAFRVDSLSPYWVSGSESTHVDSMAPAYLFIVCQSLWSSECPCAMCKCKANISQPGLDSGRE